ncbi:MAG: hypothetical protein IIZ68_11050 [Clostridia bacterium]|nr:hypothetical protein [Clostridia bacterium]
MKMNVKRSLVFLAAAALLLPMVLSGCVSADKLAERRARTDEIRAQAVTYMREKYNRGFQVKKCEFAVGDEYENDLFVTFTNDVHAFYDADEEKFYDDRQSPVINEALFNNVWMPMIKRMDVVYDNVGDWSQDFNLIYRFDKGGEEYKYSMYHDYYSGDAKKFAYNHYLSVSTENLILVSDNPPLKSLTNVLDDCMTTYFKGTRNDVRFYIVKTAYHKSANFDADTIDETVDGCSHLMSFRSDRVDLTKHQFVKVKGVEGLYAMICSKNAYAFADGDIELEPVSNSDAVSKSILENMDTKDMNLMDKYVTKKRSVNFENPVYQVKFSPNVAAQNYDEYKLAFVMKDSDEDITEYAPLKERQRSFYAYNMNGDFYNATCLCSPNSRAVPFTFGKKDKDAVYFWFGTQS